MPSYSTGDRGTATPKPQHPTEAACEFLRNLTARGWWGTLTIKLQHGDIMQIVQETSIPGDKIAAYNRTNRGENHESRQ